MARWRTCDVSRWNPDCDSCAIPGPCLSLVPHRRVPTIRSQGQSGNGRWGGYHIITATYRIGPGFALRHGAGPAAIFICGDAGGACAEG